MDAHDARLDEDKELKVKLPLSQHLKLHSLKVLTGHTISEMVAEALVRHLGDDLEAFAQDPMDLGTETDGERPA